jgi:heat shock protein 4
MMNQDRLTHETYNRKNELEAYIYQMKDQLGTKLKDFVLKADADKLAKELDVQYDWLYEDGRHAQKSEYVKRLETLKVLGDPINKRYNDYILTPDLVSDFHKVIKQVEQFSQTTVFQSY